MGPVEGREGGGAPGCRRLDCPIAGFGAGSGRPHLQGELTWTRNRVSDGPAERMRSTVNLLILRGLRLSPPPPRRQQHRPRRCRAAWHGVSVSGPAPFSLDGA